MTSPVKSMGRKLMAMNCLSAYHMTEVEPHCDLHPRSHRMYISAVAAWRLDYPCCMIIISL